MPTLFKKLFRLWLLLAFALVGHLAVSKTGMAQEAAPTASEIKELKDKVGDLEAYINNSPRVSENSSIPGPGPGHNAWMMLSAAMVLLMTFPGLALFYGGLVRAKNVLSVLAQCFGIAGLVTLLWWAFGYSLAFAKGAVDAQGNTTFWGSIIGSLDFAWLKSVDSAPNTDYAPWVSENVFAMFQMMFAIITPALMIGAIAERMKFLSLMLFVGLWMLVIYFPLAHMVWGSTGMMNGLFNPAASIKAIDFAGGTVVHMSSGWSALILCMMLGKRIGFGKDHMPPHSMVLCMVGTGLLWFGWYGFNAGSAVGADGIATNAFMTTTISAAVASFAWGLAEYITRRKASVLGFCSGAVAGLVVITPAAGFVTASSAVWMGVLAGIIPFFACFKLKSWLRYDDALDTFGVHAVGGTLGALLTGIAADGSVNPNIATLLTKLQEANKTLVGEQLKAMGLTIILAVVGTIVLATLVKIVLGLRASEEVERQGLDLSEHGESGYLY